MTTDDQPRSVAKEWTDEVFASCGALHYNLGVIPPCRACLRAKFNAVIKTIVDQVSGDICRSCKDRYPLVWVDGVWTHEVSDDGGTRWTCEAWRVRGTWYPCRPEDTP